MLFADLENLIEDRGVPGFFYTMNYLTKPFLENILHSDEAICTLNYETYNLIFTVH